MFGKLGVPELLIILALVLIIFGPKKLPGLGAAVGRTIKDFRNSVKSDKKKKDGEAEDVEEIPAEDAIYVAEASDDAASESAAPAAATATAPKTEA